ncbi:hypothetical protein P7K49_026122 [Saguinus oedipus]|uniref:Uncharacterized protein n=1 Tax=Saguinus oedipus TaxID=9490 RepID=A0ABQ9UKN4_SAGOE|nr:hypothetical protein P7K49_026122 [Saguinus oedipus]
MHQRARDTAGKHISGPRTQLANTSVGLGHSRQTHQRARDIAGKHISGPGVEGRGSLSLLLKWSIPTETCRWTQRCIGLVRTWNQWATLHGTPRGHVMHWTCVHLEPVGHARHTQGTHGALDMCAPGASGPCTAHPGDTWCIGHVRTWNQWATLHGTPRGHMAHWTRAHLEPVGHARHTQGTHGALDMCAPGASGPHCTAHPGDT